MRSRSLATSPVATAAARRTNAVVPASNLAESCGRRVIVLARQPTVNAQLAHGLAARVLDRPGAERLGLRLHTELRQDRRDGERRRRTVAVLDLEGDPEPFTHEGGAVHAVGADLRDHATRMRAHHLGARAALPRDQLRVAEHGLLNAECGVRSAEWRGDRLIIIPH